MAQSGLRHSHSSFVFGPSSFLESRFYLAFDASQYLGRDVR
jgi:hypothetical protein